MAMYYYASKLNEASCSGCNMKVPPAPAEPAPAPPTASDHGPLPPDHALLHDSGLAYYDNDDYYSMVRGNKFMSDAACKHIVMNGSINFVTAQKVEGSQLSSVLAPGVKSITAQFVNCPPEKLDVEYKDGKIMSATLETLFDMLRPGASKSYTFTFLLCSRLFLKPHELLSKLCKRYFKMYEKVGKSEVKDLGDKELTDMVSLVKILKQWTAMFPYDFRDDRVMALVRTITQRCAAEHMGSVRIEVSSMLERLLDKLTALEQYEETLVEIPQVSSLDQLVQGDILTLGLTPGELANQLTIVELHRLSFVGPEEFVQTFAPNQPTQSTSHSKPINMHHIDTKSTRNLEAYAEWFNRLSYLVATDIVKAVKSKYRARVIEQWVMTARECFNLGNFNSLMAIISALNMSPVSRLKKTWSRTSAVCGQQLRQLELCVEPSSNHARYRAALAAAPTETAVPLLSVTCRDLHFANQGSPSKKLGDDARFDLLVSKLPKDVITQLADFLTRPPDTKKYDAMKTKLLTLYEDSKTRQIEKLIGEMELGDQKPSQLLRRMRNLTRDTIPDDTLRVLWQGHLPSTVRVVLAVTDTTDLDRLAAVADNVAEVSRPGQVAEVSRPTTASDTALIIAEIAKLAGNRINFEKCSLLAKHVSAQLARRRLSSDEPRAPPPPPPQPPAWRYLAERPTLHEPALEIISFEREPPVDHAEKERYKRLRGHT